MDKETNNIDDIERLLHLTFHKAEGSIKVQNPQPLEALSSYTQPFQLWKMSIGLEESPKFASIGDYGDG